VVCRRRRRRQRCSTSAKCQCNPKIKCLTADTLSERCAFTTPSWQWTDSSSGITSDTTSSGAADCQWQFPPHDIARMLSPKLVKKENRRDVTVRPQLDHYDILITHPVVENVMLEVFATPPSPPDFTTIDDERLGANYSCIGLCNAAYNMIHERRAEITPFVINSRDKRWLLNLQFVVNDKLAGDSVRGASNPVKPDIIAIDPLTLPNPLSALVGYWNLPDELRRDPSSNARQIQFACDGRGQYTASPSSFITGVSPPATRLTWGHERHWWNSIAISVWQKRYRHREAKGGTVLPASVTQPQNIRRRTE